MKKNKIVVVVFVFLVCGMAGRVMAVDADSLLEQGNGFFDKHYYEQAKEVYESV